MMNVNDENGTGTRERGTGNGRVGRVKEVVDRRENIIMH